MRIAIEGCCHGALDAIYQHIQNLETKNDYVVDLLLICGDFQAVRNHRDLQCMAVPNKYRQLGDFYKYYTGEKKAPILTIVIGGNHEASNHFWELYHGGWLAPNIYFLGHAGCVQVGGLRIAGASGIFKGHDFRQGHFERVPYDHGTMRSIYHIREYNVRRLSLLSSPDIFLSHDWPQSIEHFGDLQGLLRRKPFFRQDVNSGKLGSPPLMGLLRNLRPKWWFSAHLHVRFEATVRHDQDGTSQPQAQSVAQPTAANPDEIAIDDDDEFSDAPAPQMAGPADASVGPSPAPVSSNPDEITLDDEAVDVATPPPPPSGNIETKFLALDKCLPKRDFLEIIDLPCAFDSLPLASLGERRIPKLGFDPEWLAITKAFDSLFPVSRRQAAYPDESAARDLIKEQLAWVQENVQAKSSPMSTSSSSDSASLFKALDDVQTFSQVAPGPGNEGSAKNHQPPYYASPQTEAFCKMLEIDNKLVKPSFLPS